MVETPRLKGGDENGLASSFIGFIHCRLRNVAISEVRERKFYQSASLLVKTMEICASVGAIWGGKHCLKCPGFDTREICRRQVIELNIDMLWISLVAHGLCSRDFTGQHCSTNGQGCVLTGKRKHQDDVRPCQIFAGDSINASEMAQLGDDGTVVEPRSEAPPHDTYHAGIQLDAGRGEHQVPRTEDANRLVFFGDDQERGSSRPSGGRGLFQRRSYSMNWTGRVMIVRTSMSWGSSP